MRSDHASAPIALLAFVLGVGVIHGSASCTLNQSGQAPEDVFGAASGSGTGGASGASNGASNGAFSGSVSGATTGSPSTTTGTGSEDCLDGQDNDGNGQVDCADTACQAGFECTDEAPAGWTDYVRVHTTPYGMSAGITCPDGSAPLHYFEGPGGPAQCAMCQCSLMGASCGAPRISCYFGVPDCSGTVDLTQQVNNTTCIGNPNVSGGGAVASCRLTAPAMVLTPGTCSTSGGMTTGKPPLWDQDILLCGGPQAGAGCAAGQVCVPKGAGDFGGSVCVTRPGTDMCPTGWTTTEIQAYGSGTDSRGCSACGCTATCTGGGYVTHDLDACASPMTGDQPNTNITSPTCVNIGNSFDNDSGSFTPQFAQPTAMCTGATPSGQVMTQDPHVICCP